MKEEKVIMNPAALKPHPRNKEFFDDMSGGKWQEFLESVKTSGVIDPVVITEDNVIVSGHQRVRACKELGITEVKCEKRYYDGNENIILKDLIETNVRQRGTIGGTDEQIRKRVDALKEIYGIKRGGDRSKSARGSFDDGTKDSVSTLKDVCEKAGTTINVYQKAQQLAKAIPEVKELIESGVISPKTARNLILRLSDSEQRELLAKLPAAQKLTQAEVQSYIDKLSTKEDEIAHRDAEIARQEDEIAALTAQKAESDRQREEAEKKARKAREDADEREMMAREAARENEQTITLLEMDKHSYLEKWERARDEMFRWKQECGRLNNEIEEFRHPPVGVKVLTETVYPPDYAELKEKSKRFDNYLEQQRAQESSPKDDGFINDFIGCAQYFLTRMDELKSNPERMNNLDENKLSEYVNALNKVIDRASTALSELGNDHAA